jgi:hypothetical protein
VNDPRLEQRRLRPASGRAREVVAPALEGYDHIVYGRGRMMYRVEVVVSANVEDNALHEMLVRANTYAIVEEVEATRARDGGDCLVVARIDAPGPVAALGSLLTVLSQTSLHLGWGEEGSVRRVAIERE